jgi:hypothetical protein
MLPLHQQGSQHGVLPCGELESTIVESVQQGFVIQQEESSNSNPREPMSNPSVHLSPTTCNKIFAEICSEQLGSPLTERVEKNFQCSNIVWKWVIFPALLDVSQGSKK